MTRPRTHSHTLAITLCAALAAWPLPAPAQPAPCRCPQPNVPPAITISPTLPADVCVPTQMVDNVCAAVAPAGGPPFAFFDDFSWRSFVALVWPALDGQRGVADPRAQPGKKSVPLVFETLKHDWELFQPNGAAPAGWASYAGTNPCNNLTLKYGDLVLASFTKYANVGQTVIGGLAPPLPAQPAPSAGPKLPGEYTRYLTGFNEVEFSQIVNNKWYITANQTSVAFTPDAKQNNPIDVKSAWRVITPGIDTSRYYTRKAYVYDLGSNQCAERTVALVGLHIVTKTPSRPQWVWSTFMQIDAIPGTPGAASSFAYNDGTGTPMPADNPIPYPPPAGQQFTFQGFAFNVTQGKPTAPSTRATSAVYQQALAKLGSGVWQYYTLVMTQWPIRAYSQDDGSPDNTFPGTGAATTAFANPLLETFDQNDVDGSCMACHTFTGGPGAGNTDFLWSLALNSYPPIVGTNASQPQFHGLNLPLRDPRLIQLKELLQRLRAAPAAKQPE